MDKKTYENLKALRKKVKAGTATFAERNIENKKTQLSAEEKREKRSKKSINNK